VKENTGDLEKIFEGQTKRLPVSLRLTYAKTKVKGDEFSRKEYMIFFPGMSTATASRDLEYGVKQGSLKKEGDKAITRYQFK